jgi:CD2 antigen cytoplasmic tail-binding protein 2
MSNKRNLEDSTFDSPPVQKNTQSKNKKVKFVSDAGPSRTFSDDGADDDLQYDELNPVGKVGKRRVKNEGYDSDSSTENAEVREKKSKTEDEDMFDADDGPSESTSKKSNKRFEKVDVGMRLKDGAAAKEYLDLGDIEGQEFGREEDDDDDETGAKKAKKSKAQADDNGDDENEFSDGYSDEEEDFVPGDEFANADDAPRARRKSRKGMGFMLSKFNMAEELTEGRMAADGSYVASVKDPEAAHDNWLEGVDSKKTMKLAREAKRKQEGTSEIIIYITSII